MDTFWVQVLVVAWGAQAVILQAVLVREALVLMSGNELAWGIVLGAWLAGVALGGATGGSLAGRVRRPARLLALAAMCLALAGCIDLWLFRGALGWLRMTAGELVSAEWMLALSAVLVTPISGLVGLAFPLVCRVAAAVTTPSSPQPPPSSVSGHPSDAGTLSRMYALESAGNLAGGAVFSFWAVEALWPVQIVLLTGAVSVMMAATVLRSRAATGVLPFGLGTLAGAMVALASLAGGELHTALTARRWATVAPGYELKADAETRYQNLTLGERGGQFALYSDGQLAITFPDPYTLAPLAHLWMCEHPNPREVLLLGGGAQGLLAEILLHPVLRVDYVETDPQQTEMIAPFLPPADRKALDDRRVNLVHTDARFFVKRQNDRYDLVIARLPEPTSALRARFYTEEFYAELARAMNQDGVFCVSVDAPPGSLPQGWASYLASIRAALRMHFVEVVVGWGDPAMILAARRRELLTTESVELARRYAGRGIQSTAFDPLMFEAFDWLDAEKLGQRSRELDAATKIEISTDLRPAVYLQRLVLWERMAGTGPGMIERLRSVQWKETAIGLAAVGALALLIWPVRDRSRRGWAQGAVVLSIATTGFATMALSIVLLFAFQSFYGYVYQRIGWIVALFMGGLVIGSLAGRRWFLQSIAGESGRGRIWTALAAVDGMQALLALAVPLILPRLAALQISPLAMLGVEVCVSAMVALTGVFGGLAFALAGGAQDSFSLEIGKAAGRLIWADHAGACIGALLTGILLVPSLGIPIAAYILVGMKLASAMIVLFLRWNSRVLAAG